VPGIGKLEMARLRGIFLSSKSLQKLEPSDVTLYKSRREKRDEKTPPNPKTMQTTLIAGDALPF